MKYKTLSLLALFAILAAGCAKVKNPPKPSALEGSYTGKFLFIHTPANATKPDTLKAVIQLNLTANQGFSVTGDTSTVHAGSRGFYQLTSGESMQFFDQTFPQSGTPVKKHLSGVYQYTFDGVYLDLTGSDLMDTLHYQYHLQRN